MRTFRERIICDDYDDAIVSHLIRNVLIFLIYLLLVQNDYCDGKFVATTNEFAQDHGIGTVDP